MTGELQNYTITFEGWKVTYPGTGIVLGSDGELWVEDGDEIAALFAPGAWHRVARVGEAPSHFREEISVEIPNDLDYEISSDMDMKALAKQHGWPTLRRYVTEWEEA